MLFQKILCSLLFISAFAFGEGISNTTGYHKNATLQRASAVTMIENIDWSSTEKVLDVECRHGKITAFIEEYLTQSSLVGVGISKEMI